MVVNFDFGDGSYLYKDCDAGNDATFMLAPDGRFVLQSLKGDLAGTGITPAWNSTENDSNNWDWIDGAMGGVDARVVIPNTFYNFAGRPPAPQQGNGSASIDLTLKHPYSFKLVIQVTLGYVGVVAPPQAGIYAQINFAGKTLTLSDTDLAVQGGKYYGAVELWYNSTDCAPTFFCSADSIQTLDDSGAGNVFSDLICHFRLLLDFYGYFGCK